MNNTEDKVEEVIIYKFSCQTSENHVNEPHMIYNVNWCISRLTSNDEYVSVDGSCRTIPKGWLDEIIIQDEKPIMFSLNRNIENFIETLVKYNTGIVLKHVQKIAYIRGLKLSDKKVLNFINSINDLLIP